MTSISINIDVPSLPEGVEFYTNAFGFAMLSKPVPGIAVLRAGNTNLCLLEKASGTRPSPQANETVATNGTGRRYTSIFMWRTSMRR